MEHRGEILEKVVRDSGMSITKFAERIGRSRANIYQLFERHNVNPDLLIKAGKILNHDFSQEIGIFDVVEEQMAKYGELESEVEHWKQKYITLLEEHNKLLKECGKVKG